MSPEKLKKFFQKSDGVDKGLILFFLFGVLIASISLFRGILMDRQVQVEYLESGGGATSGPLMEMYADIEGAVISPGVYLITPTSRIKDLLVKAGGFSEEADRGYCEKNLNMAQLLKDGQKIYIPSISNTPTVPGYTEAKERGATVNVNMASMVELDTLWGVGKARAETIVKNRSYSGPEELVSKGGMTRQIFEKNIDVIVFY